MKNEKKWKAGAVDESSRHASTGAATEGESQGTNRLPLPASYET